MNELVKVYNFEVEDFHTYYVSENSVLVHNADKYYEVRYNNDGSIKSRTWYTKYARIETHYDHTHAGVQPHIVVYSYNDQGFQGKTYWDMNGGQI